MALKRYWVRAHTTRDGFGRGHRVKGHYRYSYEHRAALRQEEGRNVHLYTNPSQRAENLRDFERRYGAKKGRRVFGAVVGKVRREQIHEGRRGHIERISPHYSTSRRGKRFYVRGHQAHV
jgi:hypothetical protein